MSNSQEPRWSWQYKDGRLIYKFPTFDNENVENEFEFNYQTPSGSPFWEIPIQFEAFFRRQPLANGIQGHTVIVISGHPFLGQKKNFQFFLSCEKHENPGNSYIPFLVKMSKAQLIEFVKGLVRFFFIEYANGRVENQ
ncbi:MAG: hypothetical protein HYZ14_17155 [Bacteroidetes bacterium]|nr:hypothetical protein [Bacteroidota bacterium]